MNKVVTFDDYALSIKSQAMSIESLLIHYAVETIEGYCKECPKYDKVWSCPPFDFNTFEYLNEFSSFVIYSGEIKFQSEGLSQEQRSQHMKEIFEKGRKVFRDFLITKEGNRNMEEALMAGHCYLCKQCSRAINKACIYPKKIRYSLEGMGIDVSSLLKESLNQELSWALETTDVLMTVGGILKK